MSATRKQWDPVTHPYRVTWYYKTNAVGCYGWGSVSETFATKEEARKVFDEPMAAGQFEVAVDYAENGATWQKDGRWQSLDKRKRTTPKGA